MKIFLVNISSLILVSYILLLFFGCKKEYIEETQKTSIVVGNNNDAKVTPIGDTLIGTLITPKYYKIDINNDGTDDIEFECIILQGPNTVQKPQSKVNSLHSNLQILGYINVDTVFKYKDTISYGVSPVSTHIEHFIPVIDTLHMIVFMMLILLLKLSLYPMEM